MTQEEKVQLVFLTYKKVLSWHEDPPEGAKCEWLIRMIQTRRHRGNRFPLDDIELLVLTHKVIGGNEDLSIDGNDQERAIQLYLAEDAIIRLANNHP